MDFDKKVKYREKEDTLYINLGKEVKEIVPTEMFNIEIGHDLRPVGVEIQDVTGVLEDYTNYSREEIRDILNDSGNIDMIIKQKESMFFVVVMVRGKLEGEEKDISLTMPVDTQGAPA